MDWKVDEWIIGLINGRLSCCCQDQDRFPGSWPLTGQDDGLWYPSHSFRALNEPWLTLIGHRIERLCFSGYRFDIMMWMNISMFLEGTALASMRICTAHWLCISVWPPPLSLAELFIRLHWLISQVITLSTQRVSVAIKFHHCCQSCN